MHRITIVTHKNGSADLIPPSPLPALETASDDSSTRDTGSPGSSPDNSGGSNQRPVKISKWRQRGMRHLPPPYPDPISLDLSLFRRRDLPIKLVVDEPVPVESNWDDPYTQSPTSPTRAGHNFRLSQLSVTSHSQSNQEGDDHSSPTRATEEKKKDDISSFADFDAFNASCAKNELTWVPFTPESEWKSESPTTVVTEKESPSVSPGSTSDTGTDDSLHVFEDTEAMEGRHHTATPTPATTVHQTASVSPTKSENGHVVRIEYQDDMVEAMEEDMVEAMEEMEEQFHATPTATSGHHTTSASVMTSDSSPVVRVEYQGEMVSVCEQTAARLEDLSWV